MLEGKPTVQHVYTATLSGKMAIKPSLVPFQKHSLGGFTIDMAPVDLPLAEAYHFTT